MLRTYPRLNGRWDTADVDFVFSVPSIVGLRGASILTRLARACNFESANGKHRVVEITLTEPEAAGAYVIRSAAHNIGIAVCIRSVPAAISFVSG